MWCRPSWVKKKNFKSIRQFPLNCVRNPNYLIMLGSIGNSGISVSQVIQEGQERYQKNRAGITWVLFGWWVLFSFTFLPTDNYELWIKKKLKKSNYSPFPFLNPIPWLTIRYYLLHYLFFSLIRYVIDNFFGQIWVGNEI